MNRKNSEQKAPASEWKDFESAMDKPLEGKAHSSQGKSNQEKDAS